MSKTLIEAINERYCDDFESKLVKFVTYPKVDEQSDAKLPKLTAIGLECKNIYKIYNDYLDLINLCPNVINMDLSENELSEWPQIFDMLGQLQRLEFLNLSGNPLAEAKLEQNGDQKMQYKNLKSLALNRTNFHWDQVALLFDFFPSLEELHLCTNGYSCLSGLEEESVSCLKTLWLNGNSISDWKEIWKLNNLHIEHLLVSENPITSVLWLEDTEDEKSSQDGKKKFKFLESINLSSLSIKNWEDLDGLKSYPTLKRIAFKKNPILNEITEKCQRNLLIALIPNIDTLNRSSISSEERKNAELYFLSYFREKEEKPNQYFELLKIYGEQTREGGREIKHTNNFQ